MSGATTTGTLPETEHHTGDGTADSSMTALRPDLLRLQLIDQGWRSLTDATDPRNKVAAEGARATIGYWPQFRQLGVPTAMVKDGAADIPDTAVWHDVYVRAGSSWIVQN